MWSCQFFTFFFERIFSSNRGPFSWHPWFLSCLAPAIIIITSINKLPSCIRHSVVSGVYVRVCVRVCVCIYVCVRMCVHVCVCMCVLPSQPYLFCIFWLGFLFVLVLRAFVRALGFLQFIFEPFSKVGLLKNIKNNNNKKCCE